MTDSNIPIEKLEELKRIARELKIEALRMIYRRGQGHPGGTFSAAEIITALYFHHLRIRPDNPGWKERDRFILSKGHASAILYAALARLGYFPASEIERWGEIGCFLQGHPDMNKTPGVDMSTGCLGHGISIATGLCLISRLQGSDSRTYVLLGDGDRCLDGLGKNAGDGVGVGVSGEDEQGMVVPTRERGRQVHLRPVGGQRLAALCFGDLEGEL